MAVKLLTTKSDQGIDDFLNEVVSLTGIMHKNLVKLKGCCIHRTQRLLVYEFLENKDLAEAYGVNDKLLMLVNCLTWKHILQMKCGLTSI